MGERLVGQDEIGTRADRQSRYAPEKAARHLLRRLVSQGAELAARRFSSSAEMREARDQFAENINQLSNEIGDISQVRIRATSSNMLASNIDFTHDETGVSVGIDATEPYIELGILAEREGFYFGAPIISGQDEDGHYAIPQLILHDTNLTPIRANDGSPISVVAVQEFTKIPIGDDTYLDIPDLEARRARKQALKKVEYKNFASGKEIMDALHHLKEAFKLTDQYAHMKLEDMDQLYRLGRVTREEADVETVTAAVRELFGRERRIVVNSMAYRGVETGKLVPFTGPCKVVDILSGHETLQLREMTLVIESDAAEDDDPALYYIPFNYVESLEF